MGSKRFQFVKLILLALVFLIYFYKRQLHPIKYLFDLTLSASAPAKLTDTLTHRVAPNIFQSYDLTNPPVFEMKPDKNEYFSKFDSLICFTNGTNMALTQARRRCTCRRGWFGPWCSFPIILKYSNPGYLENIKIRTEPRRLISAMPFNIEFELTESRFGDLADVTDLFIIGESIFSGHGDRKPLRLFDRLQEGYLKEWHHKIVYVYLDQFPEEGRKNGWIAENMYRDHLGLQGLKNQVQGTRHDDIFIYLDSDEIPVRDALVFLKLHDGYPEPFGFHLWRTVYGFFWRGGTGDWNIWSGSTIGMLAHVFEYKVSRLRNPAGHIPKLSVNVKAYVKAGRRLRLWKLGSSGHYAGWHCSWCFDLERMRIKLVSAINADFPRWGDYPEKQDLNYIQSHVTKGLWFDDKTKMAAVNSSIPMYTTPYFLNHWQKYKFLLENPYKDLR